MRCEDTSAKLADDLAGTLPDAERQALESHALSCAACREELEGAREMWQRLGRMPADAPDTGAMRARFDAMMADAAARPPAVRSRTTRWTRRHRAMRPFLQAAAAAILVVAGIQVGRQMSQPAPAVTVPDVTALRDEVRDLRQMVTLSLMQQQSVTERLKGVSWSSQLDQPGNEVVAALIDTLMHDANVNVRLASIDALRRFAERDAVRSATVRALDTQTSPLVQMALIDFVVETQDREALETLRRLSQNKEANEAVRARAAWGIDHLEAA